MSSSSFGRASEGEHRNESMVITVQRGIATDKLRIDKSGALVDEFFSERIHKARRAIDAALLKTAENQIDVREL
jgi:hypothetical protein